MTLRQPLPRQLDGRQTMLEMTRPSTPAERLQVFLEMEPTSLEEDASRKALPLVHPFPAPMSPFLARTIIEKTTEKGDVVLDPMAGSGTVPAAALSLGRKCYAMDIDPLARMALRVQCGRHSIRQVESAGRHAEGLARALREGYRVLDRRFEMDFDEETRKF